MCIFSDNENMRFFMPKCFCVFIIMYASSAFLCAQSLSIDGIWENGNRFVVIESLPDTTKKLRITLKPFYTYFYDGEYEVPFSLKGGELARLGDGLYLEYWKRGSAFSFDESLSKDGVYWRPCGNLKELSVDMPQIKKELKGYYSIIDANEVFEIRYWVASVPYKEELARIELEKKDGSTMTLYLDKYIKIGELIYTCATGRRTSIRNAKMLKKLPGLPSFSKDGSLMVLNEAYLMLSSIKNIANEIARHNALSYPPHSGRARFEEPSIFKKMEEGDIELNGGSYFKP